MASVAQTDTAPILDVNSQAIPRNGVKLPDWLEVVLLLSVTGGAAAIAQVLGPASSSGNLVALLAVFGALGLVLLMRWHRHEPWSELGLSRPDSWKRTIVLAILATTVLYVAGLFALKILLPLLGQGSPDASRFDPLRGNLRFLLGSLVGAWITAAFIEEVVFRGFLMGRLSRIFGDGRRSWIASLIVSSVIFGLLHVYQGVSGILITGLMGFLLGGIYLLVRRNLWVVILAHGLVDTVSFVAIYLGVEI